MAMPRRAKPKGETIHVVSGGVEFDCIRADGRWTIDGETFENLRDAAEHVRENKGTTVVNPNVS